jgi:hypothetical protein
LEDESESSIKGDLAACRMAALNGFGFPGSETAPWDGLNGMWAADAFFALRFAKGLRGVWEGPDVSKATDRQKKLVQHGQKAHLLLWTAYRSG